MRLNYGLTPNDLKNIANLLEIAKEQFSNHGCNDYDIENNKENQQLLLEIEKEYDDSLNMDDMDFAGETLCVMDWVLMDYYIEKLKEQL